MSSICGSKVASIGENIDVEINEDVVSSIAQSLSVALILSNDSVTQVLDRDQLEECFAYALKVVLSQDSGARPSFEVVPTFFSDITRPLRMMYRGVVVTTSALDPGERPDSYQSFLMVLQSMGIPTGKVLKLDPTETSEVLQTGLVEINGGETLVGVSDSMEIEELVVRAMLDIEEEEQEKLSRIVGHLDHFYVSRDELVRNWAGSLPVAKRA
jgi:hypothetical protein